MIRLFELGGLGAFSISSIVASVSETTSTPLLRFGALGLCAFMILQNYRQQQALGKVIGHKDEEIKRLTDRLASVSEDQTKAMNRLAQALEDRPCVADDQRARVNQ